MLGGFPSPTGADAWKLYLALGILVLIIIFRLPFIRFLIQCARKVVGHGAGQRFLADAERHLSSPLSWVLFLVFLYIDLILLKLDEYEYVIVAYLFVIGVPIILTTFAFFTVLTNMVIRYFHWDRTTHEDFGRVLIVKEGISLMCYFVVFLEITLIYLRAFVNATNAAFVLLCMLEVCLALSCFTTVKNIVGGFSLVFAQPFRVGSLCQVVKWVGFIEQVTIRNTLIRRYDASLVYIPNGIFLSQYIRNYSFRTSKDIDILLHVTHDLTTEELKLFIACLYSALSIFVIQEDMVEESVSQNEDVGSTLSRTSISESRQSSEQSDSKKGLLKEFWNSAFHPGEITFEEDSRETTPIVSTRRGIKLDAPLQVFLSSLYHIRIICKVGEVELQAYALKRTEIYLTALKTMEDHGINLFKKNDRRFLGK